MSNIHTYVTEFLRLVTLVTALFFTTGCYALWHITYRISQGHYWIGKVAVGVMAMLCVLLAVAFDKANGFRMFPYLGLGIWIWYNVWYFWRNPMPLELFKPSGRPYVIPALAKPKGWLEKPTAEVIAKRPVEFSTKFKLMAVFLIVLLAFVYGFIRVASVLAQSDRKVQALSDSLSTRIEKTEVKAVGLAAKVDTVSARADTSYFDRTLMQNQIDSLTRVTKKKGLAPAEVKRLEGDIVGLKRKLRKLENTKITVPPIKPIEPKRKDMFKSWLNVVIPHPQPGVQFMAQDTAITRSPQRIGWDYTDWKE